VTSKVSGCLLNVKYIENNAVLSATVYHC